jgi:hypothetical protein
MGNTTYALVVVVAAGAGIWAFWRVLRTTLGFGRKPEKPVAADSEGRSLSRFCTSHDAFLQVLEPQGGEPTKTYIVDLSEYGARIRLKSPLKVGTPVRLRIPEISSAAAGRVRNCARKWNGYQLGVEFQGTLYKTSF